MRWGRVVLAASLVGAAGAPFWAAPVLRPLRYFGVRRVEVTGARYLPAARIVEGLGLGPRASIFDNLDDLESRLVDAAEFESATVRRRLPGTLVVTVRERQPAALADGPEGLVAVDVAGRPLPYDLTLVPVDAPVVPRADTALLAALETIRMADVGFYAGVGAAWRRGGEVVLDLGAGRARLGLPVEPLTIQGVAAVQRDLAARAVPWRELDARFHGWVVVRPGT